MAEATCGLASKVTRAARAYLIGLGSGIASVEDTFAIPQSEPRNLPYTVIETGDGQEPEGQRFTGNWKFDAVVVTLRDTATKDPRDPDPNTNWKAALARFSAVKRALTLTGDDGSLLYMAEVLTAAGRAMAVDASNGADAAAAKYAADNADMADFTVQWWRQTGEQQPRGDDDGAAWDSTVQFECIACDGVLA